MTTLWNTLIYYPLYNLLIILSMIMPFGDIGLGIVFLTLIIKILMYPLAKSAFLTQIRQKKVQPLIKAVQEKYKDDTEKQGKEIMAIMKEHKANPLSGCLVMFIQIPIFLALFHLAKAGVTTDYSHLYSFITKPQELSPLFLSIIDIAKPSVFLAILGGILQFLQIFLTLDYQKKATEKSGVIEKPDAQAEMMQNIMLYVLPFVLIIVVIKMPALVGIYFVTNALFGIIQDFIIKKTA